MIRPIVKDTFFLCQKSQPATPADAPVIRDLLDTLAAHADHCVGMAANMIGVQKTVIAVSVGPVNMAMVNPVITKKSGPYEAEEGCLSLVGVRKAARFHTIEVKYLDEAFRPQTRTFSGWTAQIIQHEVDHCNGVVI